MSNLETGKNVAIAFALVIGSALSTGIGAAAVFFPSIVKLTSTRVLASALAFAAGVMIYVSLLEIIVKSRDSFADAGYSEGNSHLFSTLCFFGGVFFMKVVDSIVHYLGGGDHKEGHEHTKKTENEEINKHHSETELVIPHCIGCSEDPITELEEWHNKAEQEVNEVNVNSENNTTDDTFTDVGMAAQKTKTDAEIPVNDVFVGDSSKVSQNDPEFGQAKKENNEQHDEQVKSDRSHSDLSSQDGNEKLGKKEKRRLIRMGVNTALAIAIHNFPEGLATFVAALDEPKVGAVLAVALGIHNIPEGLCVALPVYYATGNRMKGFLWGLVSGLTEPIGALIGYLILAKFMRDEVYAILFGLVAGMMTYISFRELIPTAFRYDPKDTVVTNAVILGMMVMAISLVLFLL